MLTSPRWFKMYIISFGSLQLQTLYLFKSLSWKVSLKQETVKSEDQTIGMYLFFKKEIRIVLGPWHHFHYSCHPFIRTKHKLWVLFFPEPWNVYIFKIPRNWRSLNRGRNNGGSRLGICSPVLEGGQLPLASPKEGRKVRPWFGDRTPRSSCQGRMTTFKARAQMHTPQKKRQERKARWEKRQTLSKQAGGKLSCVEKKMITTYLAKAKPSCKVILPLKEGPRRTVKVPDGW